MRHEPLTPLTIDFRTFHDIRAGLQNYASQHDRGRDSNEISRRCRSKLRGITTSK